jgi:hypothetical protein
MIKYNSEKWQKDTKSKKKNCLVVMYVPEIPCETVDVPEGLSKNNVKILLSESRCGGSRCRAS